MSSDKSLHAAPVFIRDGYDPVALMPIRLGGPEHEGKEREDFVQKLVFSRPEIIPMSRIEPTFTPLISVCTELSTEAGSLDNLWITPAGGIVLGECKLFRNPQARREVVAQALDYARALSGWNFERLESTVRRKTPSVRLYDFIKDFPSALSEVDFIDAVERRLRLGSFMILIIGDGIQEGVESLTSYLQLHAGMHAGIALVDLSIWRGPDGGLLIVPRIPMKTVLVERGIVHVDENNKVRIDAPAERIARTPTQSRPQSQSEAEFYIQMAQKSPDMAISLRKFVDKLAELSIQPEPGGKSLYLRWQSPDLGILTIATIEPNGAVWFSKTLSEGKRLGVSDIVQRYVANTLGSSVRVNDNGSQEVIGGSGASNLKLLLGSDIWLRSIADLVGQLESRSHTQN